MTVPKIKHEPTLEEVIRNRQDELRGGPAPYDWRQWMPSIETILILWVVAGLSISTVLLAVLTLMMWRTL